jgi:hypothetical protein
MSSNMINPPFSLSYGSSSDRVHQTLSAGSL